MTFQFRNARLAVVSFIVLALVALLFVASKPAASQNQGAAKCFNCSVDGKTTPMTADGHPDLNGFWGPVAAGGGFDSQFERDKDGSILFDFGLDEQLKLCVDESCQEANQPSYTPAFVPKVKAIAKTEFAGTSPEDPTQSCKPTGVPRTGIVGSQIIQSPQVIAIVHGDYTDRLIYVDGRPHPKDLEESYMGNSTGHWEGNTLVVDVTGLNDDTWLGGGGFTGEQAYTSVHSNQEHVVERWTRDGDILTYEATVTDPVALTKPWVIAPRRARITKDPEAYPQPYFCDGGGIASIMREHYVKPNPEDRDVRNKCNAHRCGAVETSSKPASK